MKVHLDFESRSTVPFGKGSNAVSSYQYANHPDTSIWCMSWCIGDGEVHLWDAYAGEEFPADMIHALKEGLPFVAHSAHFEWVLWNYLLTPRYGLPELPISQMDCTAARAAAMSLPRSLDGAAKALGLSVNKDDVGSRLMMQMAKPRKPRKDEDPNALLWWDDADRRRRLGEYCIQDTIVERELDRLLKPLSDEERAVWLLDHKTNFHGVKVDLDYVKRAKKLMDVMSERYKGEVQELTGGKVRSVTEIVPMKSWLAERGVETESLDKTTIENLLETDLDPGARRLLELRQIAGKSSVSKLSRFMTLTHTDGRMRENFLYHGASTGRLAGKGAQLQNLPSRTGVDWKVSERVIELVKSYNDIPALADTLELMGDIPLLISSTLRGVICTPDDKEMYVADFSNIEGRVAAWFGGEQWKLDAFRAYDKGEGPDLYKVTAAQILGRDPSEISKTERNTLGKVPELALGFGGGFGAFDSMAAIYNVDMAEHWPAIQAALSADVLARANKNWSSFGSKSGADYEKWVASEAVKIAWRDRHPGIVSCWRDAEHCAISALKTPNRWFAFADGKCAFGSQFVNGVPFLVMRLPSGRRIYKANARLVVTTKFGRAAEQVTFYGVDSVTRRWVKMSTYGGDLFQSCLSRGTLVLTDAGWKPIETITEKDRVWDGEEWVSSAGAICNGNRPVMNLSGVEMTPDHKVLTDEGWKEASACSGRRRAESKMPDCFGERGLRWGEIPLVGSAYVLDEAAVTGEPVQEVYDILNCGPRHRFVVRDGIGQPMIVHNCVQATARDLMMSGWARVEEKGFDVVLSVHDEIGAEGPVGIDIAEFEAAMVDLPDWADGCPVSAEGYVGKRYRKD